jgi:peptidoglycan-associated lipoprotein
MNLPRFKHVGLVIFILSLLAVVGCRKSVAVNTPPPPPPVVNTPPPPAPTITLRAAPATIDRGASTTLQWEARNAATVTITPELGNVMLTGNRSVSPVSSVSYQATATGPGGSATDVARVTVNIPPPPPARDEPRPPPRPDVSISTLFHQNLRDILFDYDKADIKPEYVSILQAGANFLKSNPNIRFVIQGHCDERGSEEYNLGLGDRRANAVKEFLVAQGVPATRMNTVSYGEERPQCRDQSETCFGTNRRAHFEMTP